MPRFRTFWLVFLSIAAMLGCAAAAQETDSAGQDQDQAQARAELNRGVEAYKNARYSEAIAHFQRAVNLDPKLPLARTYLATALAQNVVPGLQTPENLNAAQQSLRIFEQVLAGDPHDVNAMKQVAALYFDINKLDDVREWQKKVLAETPRDPEAAYTIGVIDWMQAHKNAMEALQKSGLNDDGEGNPHAPPQVLSVIREKNEALVEEALDYLRQALDNRPDYDDAMVYMNLVYRRKADLDYASRAARQDDVDTARAWAGRAMAARKANEEKAVRVRSQQ